MSITLIVLLLSVYFRLGKYEYKRGKTEVLETFSRPIEIVSTTVKKLAVEEMDTA